MPTYEEKFDWYMEELTNHGQLTAEARFNSIKADYNFIHPPPSAFLEDSAYAEWWANNYDTEQGPWPPERQ